jgi:Flp pilus assembly protein TadG
MNFLKSLASLAMKLAARSGRMLQSLPGLRSHHRSIGNLARSERGESLISFALSASILFSFVFGLFEVCMAFYTYEWISECAREGSRYAIVHGASCITHTGASCTVTASGVNSYISALTLPNLGAGTMTPSTSFPDGDEAVGHRVKVTVTYTFPYQIMFKSHSTLTMSSTSEMYIMQ